jgi:hypothetical protein
VEAGNGGTVHADAEAEREAQGERGPAAFAPALTFLSSPCGRPSLRRRCSRGSSRARTFDAQRSEPHPPSSEGRNGVRRATDDTRPLRGRRRRVGAYLAAMTAKTKMVDSYGAEALALDEEEP